MFTSRITVLLIVFGLLFVTLVDARPVRHRRRSTCRAKTTSVATPSPTITEVASASAKVATGGNSNKESVAANDAPKATPSTSSLKSIPNGKSSSDDDDSTSSKSSSKATSAPVAEPSADAKSSSSKQLSSNALFPVSGFSKSWSTSSSAPNSLSLSDSTLKPTRLLSALSHDYVSAPDGKKAMRAHYPKGSYTFTHQPQGGLSFYALGPDSFGLTNAKEITFGYRVFFEKGFDWNKGGKLPGAYGGNSDDEAISCSGGRRSTACFSARLMWRTEGKGEFYTYLPPYTIPEFAANKKQCNVAPESDCNPTYGASIGRGAFNFKDGQWNTVSERVKLNDVGKANGELELFVEGKSVISVSGLILRDSDKGRFRGIQMQTFFGGSDSSWASPKDQNVYFSDFSMAILQTL